MAEVIEVKKPKAEVKGSAQTTEEIKTLLDKKQKVDKKAIQNNKQNKKVKKKIIADASYRMKFVDSVNAKVPELTKVEKDDRIILKFNKSSICRLMVRAGHRFTCYRKTETGKRELQQSTGEDFWRVSLDILFLII